MQLAPPASSSRRTRTSHSRPSSFPIPPVGRLRSSTRQAGAARPRTTLPGARVDGAAGALARSGLGDLVRRRLRVGTLPPAASGYWLGVVAVAAVVVGVAGSQLGTPGGWGRFAVLTVAASIGQVSAVQL